MKHRNLIAGLAALGSVAGATGAAVAANSAAVPSKVTIKQTQTLSMKPNRYIQDGLRWNKDLYQVKAGGTLHVVNTVASEGPHTFTVVKERDLPKTGAQIEKCAICEKLGKAHGVDPQTEGPPKFQFLDNGVGQITPPNVDRAGDSGVTGSGKKGESIDLKVTAKRGSRFYFMCLIHPWMQAKVAVG